MGALSAFGVKLVRESDLAAGLDIPKWRLDHGVVGLEEVLALEEVLFATLIRDPDSFGFLKHCPQCGYDSRTLGDVCLSCGRPYEPQSTMDALPFIDPSKFGSFPKSFQADILLMLVIGVLNLLLLIIVGIPRAVAKGLYSWVQQKRRH